MKRLARKPWAPLIMVVLFAALCSALAAGWANERKDRLEQVRALQAQIESNSAMHKASIYGLSYALREEQAKAGSFEAERDDRAEKLASTRGYIGGLRHRVKTLRAQLAQCRATNIMFTDGWTGNAAIEPGED